MKFSYKARTKEGEIEAGTIEAYSKDAAVALLQKYNIFVTSVDEQKEGGSLLKSIKIFEGKVSKKDLAIFFRQLSVMLESRVPVVQSLTSLANQTKKVKFKETLLKIAKLVEEGVSLSEAFALYPKTFGEFYVNLVKSGEMSGKIAKSLYYVSEHLEREAEIISQVKQAMIYPIFLVSVLFFVIAVIIGQVMPKLADLIKESNSTPPVLTILILNFYKFLQDYWNILALVLILIIVAIVYFFRTHQGKTFYDKMSLKLPFIGSILKKVFLVRFCSNISILLISGISINNALSITSNTVDNQVYKKVIKKLEKEVSEEEKISSLMLKNEEYFPSFVVQMIKVGEETGKLDSVLTEVVNFYEKEIKRLVDLFARLLEPIMIIILGFVVAILAFSVFSSIYGVIGAL